MLVLSPLLSLFFGFDFKTSKACFCVGNHGARGMSWVASFATFSLAQPASGWGRAPGVWAGLWNAPWLGDRGISPPFAGQGWARLVQSDGSSGSDGSSAFPCPELQLMPSPARCPLLLPRLFCVVFSLRTQDKACWQLPRAARCQHKSPVPSPAGRALGFGGCMGPLGTVPPCPPVPWGRVSRPGRARLSCGTEINFKSWQSNEPKIQRRSKLLIARVVGGLLRGVCGFYVMCQSLPGARRGGGHPPQCAAGR